MANARERETSQTADAAFLGVDGGGTHTRGMAVDAAGTTIELCEVGPTNPYGAGVERALANLKELLGRLRERTEASGRRPAAICLGLAGYDRPEDEANFRATVEGFLPGVAVRLTNDSHVALMAGAPEGFGLMLVAGTGAIAFGITADGRQARADGYGHLLGDEGSAYAIGLEALRTVFRALDGRGPKTTLTGAILERLGLRRTLEVMPWILNLDNAKAPIAALTPAVFSVWRGGDVEATRVVETALNQLTRTAGTVFARLFSESEGAERDLRVPCVLGGGMTEDADFFGALSRTLRDRFPRLDVRRSARPPVEGAVDLARRMWAERNP